MDVMIDIMEEEDLPQVMAIEREVFSDPWSMKAFLNDIKYNNHSIYFTASQGRKIVGYIGGWIINESLHITNLAVDPEFQNQGIATKLINELLNISYMQRVKRITLEVRVSNTAAISLYRKFQFKQVGYKKKYYTNDNEDALIMGKEL